MLIVNCLTVHTYLQIILLFIILARVVKKKHHFFVPLRGTHKEPKRSKDLFHKGYQKDQRSTEALVKGFFRMPLTKCIFGRPLIKVFAKLLFPYKVYTS